jgi:hypothetical protein
MVFQVYLEVRSLFIPIAPDLLNIATSKWVETPRQTVQTR